MESTFITVSTGERIYVERHSAQSSGPPILFIHGMTGTTSTFAPILPYLAHRTRILFDLPGHGRSSAPSTPHTPSSLADVVSSVLRHFSHDERAAVDLVTHSAGGLVGLQFAYERPERVRKAVLMGPAGAPVPRGMLETNARMLRARGMEAVFEMVEPWVCERVRKDARYSSALNSWREEFLSQNGEAVAQVVEALLKFEYREMPEGVEVTIVAGKEDPVGSGEDYKALARLTNGAEVVELDTGHYFAWEDTEGTGRVLRDALGD